MSTTNRSPTSIYVGAIIAVVALSSVGIILRIMAVRRMRMAALARQNTFVVPSGYPQTPQRPNTMGRPGFSPPMQPPRVFSGNGSQNWNNYPQPEPAPPYQPPTSPPPASPRLNNPGIIPRNSAFFPPPGPPPAASFSPPTFPVPCVVSPSASPLLQPTPLFPLSPADSSVPTESMSLVDRMREVQTLMLEIHNRAKIQELQRRVTELSDVSDPEPTLQQPTSQVPGTNTPREPPPYALDGRDES